MKLFLARQMVKRKRVRQLSVNELETLHLQPETPGFNDSSYFAGWEKEGFALVTRQAFRSDKPNENWLKLLIPGEGVWGFENLNLPAGEGFRQGTLAYECLVPGKQWILRYTGAVYQKKRKENIILDLTWTSTSAVIDFDKKGVNPEQTAREIARQPWNKTFFHKLQEIRKTHYEQAGKITGTITWGGRSFPVNMNGIRDHSFGKREWNHWQRHIWFLGILEDGRFFNISVIDYDFITGLKAGYLVNGEHTITFYKTHGLDEAGYTYPLPEALEFTLQERKDSPEILLKTKMIRFFPFVMDGVYYIRQSLAEFTYNGVRGMGIAEMGVNIKKYGMDISD